MEGFDALVVQVDVAEVVHALKDQVRRVVKHVGALVAAYFVKEAFKGRTVMEIFTWMNFVGQVYATAVEMIKNW